MHGALLAVVHPDNTPHGYNLTFAFPMLMFIIIAGALYLRFRGPHRVPGHIAMTSSPLVTEEPGTVTFGDATVDAVVEPQAGVATVEAEQAQPADEGTEEE